jgi:YegS/Rv2252/BmrU family lipid kinase
VALLIRRALLIVNPQSRRGAQHHDAALEAIRAAGIECDALITERIGHGGIVAAERGRSYDAVFTLGGDGTAVEIIGALAGTGTPIGILPGGTGNLIARTLGIPVSLGKAVDALVHGDRAQIDLGTLADGRRFAFSAGVGIDVRMIEGAPARLKRRIGVLAYVLSATRALIRRQDFLVRATVDGVVHERLACAAMVVNFGAVLNDLITLGPGIRSDDGLLDLCVFSPRSFRDALRVTWRLMRKDFRSDACVLYASGRHVRLETTPPRTAQADGDVIGMTPLDITVAPLAALLLVPKHD